jgi:hypothetical protein
MRSEDYGKFCALQFVLIVRIGLSSPVQTYPRRIASNRLRVTAFPVCCRDDEIASGLRPVLYPLDFVVRPEFRIVKLTARLNPA